MSGTLVLMRHGLSQWNLENRFTGFTDVPLAPAGEADAVMAGEKIRAAGLKFDVVFTSTLERAIRTAEIALRQPRTDFIMHDDLRERDYGDLTGLNKQETADKFGAEQVHIWRRSYDVPPPNGESLKNVVEDRVRPYYEAHIKPLLVQGKTVLIGAHGNTVRALLIILGVRTPENINNTEIAYGTPIVLSLDAAGKVVKEETL